MTDADPDLPIETLPPGDVLPAEEPFEGEQLDDRELVADHDTLIDRVRDTGVGVEDPNIVGDVGPTDIPPGADPHPVS